MFCKLHVRGGSYPERQQSALGMVGMVFGTDLDQGPLRIIPDPLLPLFTAKWPAPKLSTYLKGPQGGFAQAAPPEKLLYPISMERIEIWLDGRLMGAAVSMDLDSLRELAAWEDAVGIKYA